MAILRLPDADAESLLKSGRVKIGWVNCRIRARVEEDGCFRCLCYGHLARGCGGPDRRNACWKCGGPDHKSRSCKGPARCMTCSDKGSKEISHLPGSRACPVCWGILSGLKAKVRGPPG
ncbi:DNA-binding protein HEXBP-like [Leptopilina heterotoma]|uniref:DNA-binding protein HEXBP-like n=1 Tax=Leptopilina heterotoma TaxID=63436 RepID=UPI001CA80A57|nr:DNA-binding protein HEXBP-like [Leptopilina heterotoma]